MRPAVTILVGVLLVSGCGADDDEGATPAPSTTAAETRCEPATVDLTAPLGNSIELDGARLTNAHLVQSSAHDGIYFVSAEVHGPGYEGTGDVATWASTSRFGGDLLYAVDDLANELTTLRDGREVADLSTADDGVAESRACAGE